MNRLANACRRRPWISALLLAALFCRALVPLGFMPGVAADGSLALILCPAYGPAPTALAGAEGIHAHMPGMAHHGHLAGHDHAQHDAQDNCPYAGASTGMAYVQVAPAAVLQQGSPALLPFPPERFIPRGTIVPTRLPRGPPSLA